MGHLKSLQGNTSSQVWSHQTWHIFNGSHDLEQCPDWRLAQWLPVGHFQSQQRRSKIKNPTFGGGQQFCDLPHPNLQDHPKTQYSYPCFEDHWKHLHRQWTAHWRNHQRRRIGAPNSASGKPQENNKERGLLDNFQSLRRHCLSNKAGANSARLIPKIRSNVLGRRDRHSKRNLLYL